MTDTAPEWRAFDSSVLILFLNDALIAATALLQSATLVTANARDFRRVPALRLVDV